MNPQGWPAGTYFGESLEYGRELQCPAGARPTQRSIWLGREAPSSICHPERSDPIFSAAPQFGASGRVVEGSLCFFSAVRLSHPAPRHAHEGEIT